MPSCCASSSLSPASTTRPVSSRYARCETASELRAFCSTSSTAVPSFSFSSFSTRKISATTSGARPSDGSSTISNRGRCIIARPIASICCSPPLSVPACCDLRSPSHGKSASTRFASASIEPCRVKAPSRRFSHTVSSENVPRPSGTCAIPSRATDSGVPRSSRSAKTTVPPRRTMPETARSVVVFPAPFAPRRATISPSPTVRVTPCSARTGPYRASTSRSSSRAAIRPRTLRKLNRQSIRGSQMPEAVIVSTARTPIGRAHKGSLVEARPDDLCAFAIEAALAKVPGLPREEIVDVMVGCGFPQEKQGMNLGRRAALLAGLPHTVPGTTVNRFCASSLQTIRMAYHAVKAGEGDAFVAAGVESITQVSGYPKSEDEIHPALFGDNAPIANAYIPMGLTAENVAEQWDVSREDMDRFAQQSQERAVAAQDSGFFAREITPFAGVEADDGPRRSSTYEKLSELEPAFKPGGKVTAGNSCPLNDGAAAVVVMSAERASELGIAPRARIIASAVSGVEPEIMGVG